MWVKRTLQIKRYLRRYTGVFECCFWRIAAEQKARATYEHLMCFTTNPEVLNPLRFLREREVVHYQRFGECHEILQAMCIEPNPCDDIMAQTGLAGASMGKSCGMAGMTMPPYTNMAGAATKMAGA
ncbi:MAG TPA: manganese catalase family protein, partial [Clostridia bacterium]|nr:manganese catalase family protein [Clostridia bacterium]